VAAAATTGVSFISEADENRQRDDGGGENLADFVHLCPSTGEHSLSNRGVSSQIEPSWRRGHGHGAAVIGRVDQL
jgi:hypothetical protein